MRTEATFVLPLLPCSLTFTPSLNMNCVLQTVSEDMVVDRWDLAWLASPYVLLLTLGSGHTGVPQVLS